MSRLDPFEALLVLRGTLLGRGIATATAVVLAEAVLGELAGASLPTRRQLDQVTRDARIYTVLPSAGATACAQRFGISRAAVYRAEARHRRRGGG